jgi:hypothetical protein
MDAEELASHISELVSVRAAYTSVERMELAVDLISSE